VFNLIFLIILLVSWAFIPIIRREFHQNFKIKCQKNSKISQAISHSQFADGFHPAGVLYASILGYSNYLFVIFTNQSALLRI
jgi:hypothetical protein